MNAQTTGDFNLDDVLVRPAQEEDYSAVRELFRAGLHEGLVPDNDTGADIETLHDAYFSDDGQSNFWVARYDDNVVGMIGVQKTSQDTAEIRRLRVREGHRRHGVGTKLVEQALTFCRHHAYLKIILDVRIERGPAIALFEKFGFQLARSREVGGRKMLDFYFDLYRDPSV
ncbi:MAG: GNAT family N-acetyltransferase [Phycisphaerales bacterium]